MTRRDVQKEGLNSGDLEFLQRHGIAETEVHAQIQRLRQAPAARRLERPCTPGDGILAADEELIELALDAWQRLGGKEAYEKWIPASGAASRMFRDLIVGDEQALATLEREIDRFPFAEELLQATDGDRDAIVLATALIEEPLGYDRLPKALIPFHRYPDGPRTAFVEHIVEAQLFGKHEPALTFTVSAEHRSLFEQAVVDLPVGPCRIQLSEQSVASSTLAWDPENEEIVRGADGRPLLRPGGHGSPQEHAAASSGS